MPSRSSRELQRMYAEEDVTMRQTFRSFALVTTWELLTLRSILPFVVVVQLIIAGGTVYGLGYLFPQIDPLSAKYIVTGAVTMTLIALGLTLAPQHIAQMKSKGTFDYLWSLPVPRVVFLASDFLVWTAVATPGVVAALVIGSHRYDFALDPSAWTVPAFLLVALTSVTLGMSIAHLSPSPMLTGILTNVIIFSLFLFSPVNFPAERLPEWLQSVHRVLPIVYMADLVRGTTASGLADHVGRSAVVVGVWCAASTAALFAVFTRRS